MILSFDQLASGGLNKDANNELLPIQPFVWTEAQNVRFKDGSVKKMGGSEVIIATPIVPYFSTRIVNGSNAYYLIGGLNKFYVNYSGANYNITRQTSSVDVDYSGSADNNWTYTILNTFPIFNNGVDAPQAWTSLSHTTKLSNLATWPASTTCGIMRSFKAYLIAGNITTSTAKYPNRIMWSGAAAPGGLPTTWDPTDVTQDAGYIDLSDTPDEIVDFKVLGDNLIVYKLHATYILQYVGGNSIFAIKTQFFNTGALSKNCIAEVKGRHLVLTTDDIIMTDGNAMNSIIDGSLKNTIFASVKSDIMTRSFVVPNYRNSEIWICVPSGTTTYPNIAYIYNYENQTWTTRTLTQTPWISAGFLDIPTVGTYDSYNTTIFNDATFNYDSSKYNKTSMLLTLVDTANSQLVLVDSNVNKELTVPMTCIVERKNIRISDDQSVKTVKRIWPKMSYASGIDSHVQFYIGTQMKPNDAITWNGPYLFDIVNDTSVDLFVTGRYISIRIRSNTDISWTLENLDIDIATGGRW